jgi:hypothetical protein
MARVAGSSPAGGTALQTTTDTPGWRNWYTQRTVSPLSDSAHGSSSLPPGNEPVSFGPVVLTRQGRTGPLCAPIVSAFGKEGNRFLNVTLYCAFSAHTSSAGPSAGFCTSGRHAACPAPSEAPHARSGNGNRAIAPCRFPFSTRRPPVIMNLLIVATTDLRRQSTTGISSG